MYSNNELEKPELEHFVENDAEIISKEEQSFRVASYNILSSRIYDPNGRFYNPEKDYKLTWTFRKNLMIRALQELNIDILALQEVRPDQLAFITENMPEFGVIGYSEHSGKSLDQIRSENLSDDDVREIVPIMYRRDKFRPIDSHAWFLSETPDVVSTMPGASRPRIVVAVVLENLVDNTHVVVSNTHYNHMMSTERLQHSGHLEYSFLEEYKQTFNATEIIYMGDRNSFVDAACDGNQWYSMFRRETCAEDTRNLAMQHFGAAPTFIGYEPDNFKTPYNQESERFSPKVLDTIFYKGSGRVSKSLNSLVEYELTPSENVSPSSARLCSFFGRPKNPLQRQFVSDHSCVMADIAHNTPSRS